MERAFRNSAGDGVGDGDDVFVGGDVVEAQAGGAVEGSEGGDFAQTGDDFEVLFRRFPEPESGVEPKLAFGNAAIQDAFDSRA